MKSTDYKTGEQVIFESLVDIECPFCGGEAAAIVINEQDGGVMHSVPECERFKELEPDEFLRECRIEIQGGKGKLN